MVQASSHKTMRDFLYGAVHLPELRRNMGLNQQQILKMQNQKLRRIIHYSYNTVPYYHRLFRKNNLKPTDIQTVHDLKKIPILTKETLKTTDLKEFVPINANTDYFCLMRTSGTTGFPVKFYRDNESRLRAFVNDCLWQLNCGAKLRDRQLALAVGWVPKHLSQNLGMFRVRHVFSADSIKCQIQQIREFNPDTIVSLPSYLTRVGKVIQEQNLPRITPNLIVTGGEFVDSATRDFIEEIFETELFDGYGANEVGAIGKECRYHSGHHVCGDAVLVEVTKDGEPLGVGEEGEVTVTDLINRATPIIRYNLKDFGFLGGTECPCGNHYPLLKLTGGRKIDYLRLPDGQTVSAIPFYMGLTPIEGIQQFQVIQEEIDRFQVKVVKGKHFTSETVSQIQSTMKQTLGSVFVEIETVDQIPRGNSAKSRPFITKVDVA